MGDQLAPMNTRSAASYLGLSSSTIEKMRVWGTGPRYLKLGKNVRYRAADLDAWLAARVIQSTSQIPGGVQ